MFPSYVSKLTLTSWTLWRNFRVKFYLMRMWMTRLNNFFCFRFGLWHFFISKSFCFNTEWIPFFNQDHCLLQFVTLNYSLSPKKSSKNLSPESLEISWLKSTKISWLSVRQKFKIFLLEFLKGQAIILSYSSAIPLIIENWPFTVNTCIFTRSDNFFFSNPSFEFVQKSSKFC